MRDWIFPGSPPRLLLLSLGVTLMGGGCKLEDIDAFEDDDSADSLTEGSLSAFPETLDFGGVTVGESVLGLVVLTETAGGVVDATFSLTGDPAFALTGNLAQTHFVPGGELEMEVQFTPAASGAVTASLTIDGGPSPLTLSFMGEGE